MHDAGHEVVDQAEAGTELLAPVLAQLHRRGADEDREQDQRQHVAEAIAVVADEGAEEVPRHEHLDDRHRCHVRLFRALCDVLRGGAAVLLEELGPGLGRHRRAGLDHVHHHDAEGHGDRHVQEEEHEGAHRERPERREVVELGDAHRERGEDERDDHEEQHAQEDLPDRVEHEGRELARGLEETRRGLADQQGGAAGQGADEEADQDAIGKPGARFRRHVVVPRHRPAPAMVTSAGIMRLTVLIAVLILAGCSAVGPAAEQLYPAHAASNRARPGDPDSGPARLAPRARRRRRRGLARQHAQAADERLRGACAAHRSGDARAAGRWPGAGRHLRGRGRQGLLPAAHARAARGRRLPVHQSRPPGRAAARTPLRLHLRLAPGHREDRREARRADRADPPRLRRSLPARRRRRAQHGRGHRALLRALRRRGRAGRQFLPGHRPRPLEAASCRAARHAEPGHGDRRPQIPERLPRRHLGAADRGRRDHAVHVPAVPAPARGLGRQHQRQAPRLRHLRHGVLAPLRVVDLRPPHPAPHGPAPRGVAAAGRVRALVREAAGARPALRLVADGAGRRRAAREAAAARRRLRADATAARVREASAASRSRGCARSRSSCRRRASTTRR